MRGGDLGDAARQVAVHDTVRALLDPKPETIEASRRALERLANFRASLDPQHRRTLH
jgi:hypothetical protein